MDKFNEEMFKDDIVIQCKNEKQVRNLLNYLKNSPDYDEYEFFGESMKGDFYYDSIHCNKKIWCGYCTKEWFDGYGYKFYKYEDVILKEKKEESKTNINFRRTILNEVFKGGRIATINFIKKDGSERTMNCRIKRVDGEKRSTKERKKNDEVMTFWEISKQQYRSVKLDSIKSVSGRNETITF